MKRDNKPPFTLPLLLNCRLENESQGLCSLFFWNSFNTFGFKDPHWVCGAINNSLSTTGFCKQLVSSMDWTSSGNLHNSQQGIPATDGSWARQAEMWVELEMQPDLKCNFPYVCEDILTKIRRNLLGSQLYGLLCFIGYKYLNEAFPMGKAYITLLSGVRSFLKRVKNKLWLFHQHFPFSSP